MDRFIEILVDSGVEWSARIEQRRVGDNTVFVAGDGQLAACLDKRVTEETVLFMARMKQPGLMAVFIGSRSPQRTPKRRSTLPQFIAQTDLKWR